MAKKNKQPNMQKRPTAVIKEETPEEVAARLEARYTRLSSSLVIPKGSDGINTMTYSDMNGSVSRSRRFEIQKQMEDNRWQTVDAEKDIFIIGHEEDAPPEVWHLFHYTEHRGLAIEAADRYATANPNTYVRVIDLKTVTTFRGKKKQAVVLRPIIRKAKAQKDVA